MRRSAVAGLALRGGARAIHPIAPLLHDVDVVVREAAALSLARLGYCLPGGVDSTAGSGGSQAIRSLEVPLSGGDFDAGEGAQDVQPEGASATPLVDHVGLTVTQRAVRVFISSTFRDMQAERDILVKRIFPELRKRCREWGVEFVEVDLRWGVTEEQVERGEVLPICLKEIENCRPYFLGLVGERYGWVPANLPEELVAIHPWLAEHREKSVTELEILHGVLQSPAMAGRAFFYLRDPAYVGQIPEAQRADFEPESDTARAKLDVLKGLIRVSGFPLLDGYPNPDAVGQQILHDLSAAIEHDFPASSEPDPLERETLEHFAFGESRAKTYVGRSQYFNRLDQHVASSDPPLVVLGESGSGKSALLANWVMRFQRTRPRDFVLVHFIGSSPQSADWTAMLRRIMGELKRRLGLHGEIPDTPEELRIAFASWLHMAAAKGRMTLVLDALDQLEDRDGAPDLVWLPQVIPSNVRVVLSTLPGRSLDAIAKRNWPTLTVQALRDDERKELVRALLWRYRKRLTDAQVDRIVSAPQAGNPLYLRALLEELRIFGIHERLDQRVGYYLEATTVSDLYQKILNRLEEDYERERPGLVRDAMSLLWAARRGLAESELLDLLAQRGNPLPRAIWSPLYLALQESLVSRSGLLAFFHDYLRRAVESRYLEGVTDRQAAHARLADYFDRQMIMQRQHGAPYEARVQSFLKRAVGEGVTVDPVTERIVRRELAAYTLSAREVDELPYQLAKASLWDRLKDLLAQPDFAATAWLVDRFALMRYWRQVEEETGYRPVDAYAPVLHEPSQHAAHLADLARLLSATGHPDQALAAYEALANHYRQIDDPLFVAFCLGNMATVYLDKGNLPRAAELHEEAETIYHRLHMHPPTGLLKLSQGDVFRIRGDLDRALGSYQQAADHARQCNDRAGLADALGNSALIYAQRGELERAIELHLEEEKICRQLNDQDGLQTSLGNRAGVHRVRGELDLAWALLEEKERICREQVNERGMAYAWSEQALILNARGDAEGALALLDRVESASRKLDAKGLLQSCLGNQAAVLIQLGDYDEAMPRLEEQERIATEMGDLKAIARSLANRALVLKANRELPRALELMNEQERICRQIGSQEGLAIALFNQAHTLVQLHRLKEARNKAREAHEIACRHGLARLARQMETLVHELRQ